MVLELCVPQGASCAPLTDEDCQLGSSTVQTVQCSHKSSITAAAASPKYMHIQPGTFPNPIHSIPKVSQAYLHTSQQTF